MKHGTVNMAYFKVRICLSLLLWLFLMCSMVDAVTEMQCVQTNRRIFINKEMSSEKLVQLKVSRPLFEGIFCCENITL